MSSAPEQGADDALALQLLGRPACHLCEDMLGILRPFLDAGRIRLSLIDVDSDPALAGRYGLLIPVLLDGQREIARYTLQADVLEHYLQHGASA